ncbi:MAG: DNA recombinase, partial [Clostridia bacterium]|nr:DNA recombinase [Clostridia bacterium]
MQNIRHERPNTAHHFRVGVYIRYFNQTKHENYLAYHIQDFKDTLSLCPNWELVDFYIDEGASPPNMENA